MAEKQEKVDEKTENKVVKAPSKKRVCFFCENKKEPTFTDAVSLRKFMSDRSRIISRLRSGVCSKHQRRVAKQIKYARHLSLLPFVTTV